MYSVSLQSSTSYIATINVSDSVHYGEWQLNLTVYSGPYTVRIAAITDLTFEYTLYRFDLSSSYGFTTVEGNPQQGKLSPNVSLLIAVSLYITAKTFGLLQPHFRLSELHHCDQGMLPNRFS